MDGGAAAGMEGAELNFSVCVFGLLKVETDCLIVSLQTSTVSAKTAAGGSGVTSD